MAAALRAVEFYSGIGGMHYALKSCTAQANIIAAIDINTTANAVYAHNFPDTTLLNRNIEGIKLDEFIKFNADIFTMSPPCQPFTRQGNQKASDDPRTKSFLHVMKIIESLPKPPAYILMENVKGFEVSETRNEFIKTLRETNYCFQEFLLSPSQFGLPNSRLRYFLIAARNPRQLPFSNTESIMNSLPATLHVNSKPCSSLYIKNPRSQCPVCNKQTLQQSKPVESQFNETTNNTEDLLSFVQRETLCNRTGCEDSSETSSLKNVCSNEDKQNAEQSADLALYSTRNEEDLKTDSQEEYHKNNWNKTSSEMKTIQGYLEEHIENSKEFLVPEKILKNKVLLMDIVQKKCNHSCCFTKGYGHYVEGTGSVLQTSSIDSSAIFERYSKANEDEKIKLLTPLGLRYFTPREIANILCFPKYFEFPETVTTKQKYRLLGNSLNVLMVTELLNLLFISEIS